MFVLAFALAPNEVANVLPGWLPPLPLLDEPREVPSLWGDHELFKTRVPPGRDAPLDAGRFEPRTATTTDVSGFGYDFAVDLGVALGVFESALSDEVPRSWSGPASEPWFIYALPPPLVAGIRRRVRDARVVVADWRATVLARYAENGRALPFDLNEVLDHAWLSLSQLCSDDVASGARTLFIAELIG